MKNRSIFYVIVIISLILFTGCDDVVDGVSSIFEGFITLMVVLLKIFGILAIISLVLWFIGRIAGDRD
ncbi:MAG: hypothetical protein A2X19_06085 [Bacteroidetes bacterium GWE2_39_28]|nr:MAG: hypothetical protein A2X19_06085 [Bacteroidetes bacterium GWE2_39_28]OFY12812.1 MAG: hypothetical protein A2X16_00865 [Bacteroidetes bacterium GWF2_39_10]OFZ11034.1 MAG: hypothetical protein A2465_00900 [Bacteroidetes bacterium RIFOXYC2_FULL_39_11]HCT93709.1 hypothetical protein [Rikenellaceae bacterium]